MPARRILGVTIGLLILLTGCQTAEPVQRLPELRFNHLLPIKIDVGAIEVLSHHEPQWAHDRLKAVGSSERRAVFIVRQAHVVEKQLAADMDFTRYFKKQQSERYDAHLDVVLEIRDENGRAIGEATATANRGRTVAEDITPNERDRIWQEMVEALLIDMNNVLESAMQQHLARYVSLLP
ncbi:MAG: hypothetical protein FD153_617 [Rhodospirillaceae bacterium]|nr:MAG: hypothetical protein FD153_617 [Rhodospirillaceae bacterium]